MLEKAKALFSKKDKPDERTQEQKKADLTKGIAEAQKFLEDKKLSSDQVKKKLPAIKSKYKITIFELVADVKSKAKETVHIHGEIHSVPVVDDGKMVDKEDSCVTNFSGPTFNTEKAMLNHAGQNNGGFIGEETLDWEPTNAPAGGDNYQQRAFIETKRGRLRVFCYWCDPEKMENGNKEYGWTRVINEDPKFHDLSESDTRKRDDEAKAAAKAAAKAIAQEEKPLKPKKLKPKPPKGGWKNYDSDDD